MSKRFYEHLGFTIASSWQGGAEITVGSYSFILQDFYVKDWADNFMMQLVVDDIDEWWRHIEAAKLQETFNVRKPIAPEKKPWGMLAHFFDPAGVLWHVTSSAV